MSSFSRNVPILATSQAMMMISNSLIITTSALVGFALAADKSLATLPLAVQFIATMLVTMPASYLMDRIGRKQGFILAIFFGVAGVSIAAFAIVNQAFWWFVVATVFIGAFNAFGNYFRFAAADSVEHDLKGKAISYVMAGGLIAAFIGPNLANHSRDWIIGAQFAGSYASLVVVYLIALTVLSFLKLPASSHEHADSSNEPARSLLDIARQPKFIVALICGMFGYGVMVLVMTATPLAMAHHEHPFSETSFVIQWHIVGMFAPSFFTGFLMKRIGLYNILIIGALFGFGCVIINLYGTSVTHFWAALFMLGLSWNFMFIGATTLLTETYTPAERAKTQAVNEFSVFTIVALASLSAGSLQHLYGWETVNIGVLPLLSVVFLSVLWLKYIQHEDTEEHDEMEQPVEL